MIALLKAEAHLMILCWLYCACWGLAAGYKPRPQVVDRGTDMVASCDIYKKAVVNHAVGRLEEHPACKNLEVMGVGLPLVRLG